MRAKEFLTESEGGMARRAEEAGRGKRVAFKNASGDVIDMIAAQVFPMDSDRSDDYSQLAVEINDWLTANGIASQNAMTLPATGGLTVPEKAGTALVMAFNDASNNKKLAFIALKPNKKPGAYPFFLQTKQFSDLTGYVQLSAKKGEESQVSGVQQRALTNLKPVGILPTNQEIAIDDVPSQCQAYLQSRQDLAPEIRTQVVELLEQVSAGSTNPVPGAGDYAKSYEIDLGETAAPIALVKGKFVSGSWRDAEAGMSMSFSNIRGVIFPNDPAEKLYDSYLVINNKNRVRVSSKDKAGGAKASVSGVVDDITNYPDRYTGLFEDPDMAKMLEVVQIIKEPDMSLVSSSGQFKRNGAIAGALQLGILTEVIDKKQAITIMRIIDTDTQRMSNNELGDLEVILGYKGTDDNTRPDYRIGWHLLAGVATEAANRVNKNYKTDAFFKAVLERSNMIQVKTSLKQSPVTDPSGDKSNGAYFSNFEVIYPPVFTGTIRLDASSNFYATRRPVGKMGFAIK